jgi:hypothetical protein
MNTSAKVIISLFILLILAVGGAGYFFWQYQKARQATAATENATAADPGEVARVVELVSQHVVLPGSEEPTVATITDTSVLQGQEFFRNAKVGHKVLVYQQARVAILYDPDIDRVINMSQISPTPAAPADDTVPPDDATPEPVE